MPSLRQLLSLRLAAGEARPWAEAAVRGLDMSEPARLARATEQGFEGPWYHGTERLDRLVEGGRIDPRRATSGPMPYFTDDPRVASNYAAGKPDTSRMLTDDGDVANYFTVAAKDVWPGSRVRTPLSVEQSWNYLPSEVKARILEQAPRVGYGRNAAGDFQRDLGYMLHGEGVHGGLSSADQVSRDRTRRGAYSMTDTWDKNHRYTPKEWVEQLANDIDSGENSFVWTSIPDRITERLKAMGYDGVIDSGGKSGGVGHRVAIPFEANSVRSRFAAFDPEARDQANLLAGAAVAAPVGGLTLREVLRDRAGT